MNLTGDAGADYLADGLTDELIAELGQLSPRPPGGDRAHVGDELPQHAEDASPQIGRELNVRFVVESSLRREGARHPRRQQPGRVTDQAPIAVWSETFGGGATTGAESQTGAAIRMARLVARAHAARRAAPATRRAGTASVAAWDRLIEGRALMNGGSADDVRRAIAAFEAATRATRRSRRRGPSKPRRATCS